MSDARRDSGVVRRLRRAGVLLVCGVVMTVLMSAVTALWVPEGSGYEPEFILHENEREFVTRHGQLYSMDAVSWFAPFRSRTAVPVGSKEDGEALVFWLGNTPERIEGSWPIHVDERDADMNWSSMWMVWPRAMFEVRSGWPVAAMRSRRVTNWDEEEFTNITQCDGLEVPASGLGEFLRFTLEGNSLNSPYRPVPLVPVWPGFAACSVFWAGVVGAAWYVPGMVRGAVRRRKGLCAKCGYEMRGLAACPECGTRVGKVAASEVGEGVVA